MKTYSPRNIQFVFDGLYPATICFEIFLELYFIRYWFILYQIEYGFECPGYMFDMNRGIVFYSKFLKWDHQSGIIEYIQLKTTKWSARHSNFLQ